jgi:hypothetical protein
MKHPYACEDRRDAHGFLCRPSVPRRLTVGDFLIEKRRRLGSSDRHKTGRRSGGFCRIAELAYDPEELGAKV